MCTVSYIPDKNGFTLSSNRDESPLRPRAVPPQKFEHGTQALFYPKDTLAGGSWFVISEKEYTLCLMNGAFVKHVRKPAYAKSRGIMVLEFFDYPSKEAFLQEYDFSGIEPFTLIIVFFGGKKTVTEVRWDGERLHVHPKDETKAHIWSSTTLYAAEAATRREQWFQDFLLSVPQPGQDALVNFHSSTPDNDLENGFVMNRNELVKTVSITSVYRTAEFMTIVYKDISSGKIYRFRVLQMNGQTCLL